MEAQIGRVAVRAAVGMNIFVFDSEAMPDVESGRHLCGLDGLNDADTGRRGHLSLAACQQELEFHRQTLEQDNKPRFREFPEDRVAG